MDPFQSLLIELSTKLDKKDLDVIKFSCRQIIPAGRLEEVDTPLQLWVLLSERAYLSRENTQFLIELIESSGRLDLIQIIQEYNKRILKNDQNSIPPSDNKQPPITTSNNTQIEREIELIVSLMGSNWKPFARKLQLSDPDILYIEETVKYSRECCRQSILTWYNRADFTTTPPVAQLIKSLRRFGLNLIADKLEDLQLQKSE